MNIAIYGLGYVGTVTAACLARGPHRVIGVDPDAGKVAAIEGSRSPVVEPGLDALVAETRADGKFEATTDGSDAVARSDVSLLCVGTPSRPDGGVDLSALLQVTRDVGSQLAAADAYHVVVVRSTVPLSAVEAELVPQLESSSGRRAGDDFGVAMSPEFLREGTGIADFFDPPLTVIGARDGRSAAAVREVFAFIDPEPRIVSIATAAAVKYVSNAFHATKIAFANEIGRLLRNQGIDSREVMELVCADDKLNLSSAYLRPGFAFGGSCLPKDLRAVLNDARLGNVDVPVLGAILPSNERHIAEVVSRVLDSGARRVALLGLSFKPETDDLRESPFVALAETLVGKGIELRVYDPVVNPSGMIGANRRYMEQHLPHLRVMLADTPETALRSADLALVAVADAAIAQALFRARPERVLDLNGRLPHAVEELPGYEGVAW